MAQKKRKKKKRKLTPEQRAKRKYKTDIRTTFLNCEFTHIPSRNVNIEVKGWTGEIDSIFIFKNIILLIEDTYIEKQKDILDHLRKKADFFEHLINNIRALLETLQESFARFKEIIDNQTEYNTDEYKIINLYCSRFDVEQKYKNRYNKTFQFLDYSYLQYFLNLSRTIHITARIELLKFLGLCLSEIGIENSGQSIKKYEGLLLPETPSGFPTGHKLVSFLVDPEMLLEQSYVMRTDSWRDSECLYQRLLIRNKINNMREFLAKGKRVFVNNIIVTLPSDTVLKRKNGEIVANSLSRRYEPIDIEIPKRFNSIGIIDGQHRVYSYHEGIDNLESVIAIQRKKQNLLVTGIVYPSELTENKKRRFEATLFLEINDKQKRVQGDLKQSIEVIINPTSAIAIAKAVINNLSKDGPLSTKLETHFYDMAKIKTASIVSYGLRHIVAIKGEFSFYKLWRSSEKTSIRQDNRILDSYIKYCTKKINTFVSAFKNNIPDTMWTADKKASRVLTTTTINGLIFCIRKLIENRQINDFNYYNKAFRKMKISFSPNQFIYKSSHWKDLGEKIYNQCFKV